MLGLHPDFLDWLSTRPVPDDADAPVFSALVDKALNGDHGLSNTFVELLDKAGIACTRTSTRSEPQRS